MRYLVVDPGKMTGYGFLEWTPAKPYPTDLAFRGGELEMDAFLDTAAHWVGGVDGVVCETFDVREDTAQKAGGAQLWSAEQIGVLRMWCRWKGIPFVLQTPGDMKPFDDGTRKTKTKKLGWWQARNPGEKGHRRDAASHALLFAVRRNLIDPRRLV